MPMPGNSNWQGWGDGRLLAPARARRAGAMVLLVTATRHADPASSPEFEAARLCASAPPGTQLIEYFEIRGVLHACLIHAGGIQTFALTETARIRTPLQ